MRHHQCNQHVGMMSEFGRRVGPSPSGLLRPPKSCVSFCLFAYYCACNDGLFLAKHYAGCRLPLEGLIGLESVMIEQLTRTHAEPQVWILTSTNGGLHIHVLSLYVLIHCDRRGMESAVRNEERLNRVSDGEKFVKLCLPTAAVLRQLGPAVFE